MFATLVLVAEAAGVADAAVGTAAAVYFWARLVHALAYALAVPGLRTLAFGVDFAARAAVACGCWPRHETHRRPCASDTGRRRYPRPMDQPIVGYHQDEERHWVAELACGHNQHVRHDPPWTNRPWVTTAEGRAAVLGRTLECRKCDAGAPRDRPA